VALILCFRCQPEWDTVSRSEIVARDEIDLIGQSVFVLFAGFESVGFWADVRSGSMHCTVLLSEVPVDVSAGAPPQPIRISAIVKPECQLISEHNRTFLLPLLLLTCGGTCVEVYPWELRF